MADALLIIVPLLGAVLPIVVTQLSKDEELRKLGRTVVKYTILIPTILTIAVVGAVRFIV